MARKNFSKGIEAILGGEKKINKNKISSKSKNLIRTTFRLNEDVMKQIKALAYWERQTTTTIISQALQQFLASKNSDYLKEAIENFRENPTLEN